MDFKKSLHKTLKASLLSIGVSAGIFAGVPAVGVFTAEQVLAQQNSLDDLFSRLKNEANPERAANIAKDIITKIKQSDNKTVELLMTWFDEAYGERRDLGTALDLLDQITVLDPNYAEGWNRRATLYYEQEKLGLSLKDVERTLAIEPRHFGALTGLAFILERTGYPQKAEKAWAAVLEVYPANRRAQSAYIRLFEENAPIKH